MMILFAALLLPGFSSCALQSGAGSHQPRLQLTGDALRITLDDQRLILQAVEDDMLSLRWDDERLSPAEREFLEAQRMPLTGNSGDPQMEVQSELRMIDRYRAAAGKFEIESRTGGVDVFRNGEYLWGLDFTGFGHASDFRFQTGENNTLYGLGGVDDDIRLNGLSRRLRNESKYGDHTYLYVPFIFSRDGDGFFIQGHIQDAMGFGSEADGSFQLNQQLDEGTLLYWHEADTRQLVRRFYELGGDRPLAPEWFYGYIQSRYGYRNQQEAQEVVEEFAVRNIPLSALVLDLYWFARMGDYDWDEANWDYRELDRFLENRGVKTVTITEPYVREDALMFQPLEDMGAMGADREGNTVTWNSWWTFSQAKEGGIIDIFAPGAEEYLARQYQRMKEQGIDGFWTDLGEPEERPNEILFGGALQDRSKRIRGFLVHNYYNQHWSRIIVDAMKEIQPGTRQVILSRSGNWQSPSLGVSVWTGDVQSSWEALAQQPAQGITAGLTGFQLWGHDVGGFIARNGIPDAELFLRWNQFGLWSPVHRAHGSGSPREPFIHEQSSEDPMARLTVQSVVLREQLKTFYESLHLQSIRENLPIMRPLFLEYPRWEQAWNISDAYMLGESIYVQPLTAPMTRLEEFSLSLPPGQWYDFYSGKRYVSGGADVTPEYEPVLETIPVMLSPGAIMPMDSPRGFGSQREPARRNRGIVTLVPHASEGGESEFVWLKSDGESSVDMGAEPESLPGVHFLLRGETLTMRLTGGYAANPETRLNLELRVPAEVPGAGGDESWTLQGAYYTREVQLSPSASEIEVELASSGE
ncbi:glycoside hydrolase family 31 protein [Salinispira pacifica]|uniref:Alpha-glucosidase n=1 Tax=Salinispira pacifica TaxID=1307761 RepID=V5WEJ6_9SPIO|nr:TIM-barrel domain-containing protein [Salinispira pacifica]AHC13984.1 Alpha-glucosidase [Salinispira pacifica]